MPNISYYLILSLSSSIDANGEKILSAERDKLLETYVSEYIDVDKRALELGFGAPTGLSILPRNFDTAKSADQLIHESTAPTIRTLLRQAGVPETKFEKEGRRIPQGSKKSWEWIGPIIFIGQEMLNDVAVPIMLNVISSYLYDIFKGHRHDAEVTLEYVVETVEQTNIGEKREYKRITFKGTPNDLKAFDVNMLKQLTRKTTK